MDNPATGYTFQVAFTAPRAPPEQIREETTNHTNDTKELLLDANDGNAGRQNGSFEAARVNLKSQARNPKQKGNPKDGNSKRAIQIPACP
jgi:hypothetical protein